MSISKTLKCFRDMLELLIPVNQVQHSLKKRDLDLEVTLYHITATNEWVKWLVTRTMLVIVITVTCDNDVCSSSRSPSSQSWLIIRCEWLSWADWPNQPSSLPHRWPISRRSTLGSVLWGYMCFNALCSRQTGWQTLTLTLISCPSHARILLLHSFSA